MTAEHVQVGTVEVLRARVVPIDGEVGLNVPAPTTVVVPPGVYPLYRYYDVRYWMMRGQVNHRIAKMSDGMFGMVDGDVASGPDVTFPSRKFGPDAWAEFLSEPLCDDHHPEQRLRIREATDA